jgi:TonB family protein
MATVTTSEFVKTREAVASFSMIEHKGIVARLVEEGSLAVKDFTGDPRGFIREIFFDEAKDLQRSKRIRAGLALGLAFQLVVITAIAIAGWHRATAETTDTEIIWVPRKPPVNPEKPVEEPPSSGDGSTKTSTPPKGVKGAGGSPGGGGQENPAPPSKGQIPEFSSKPPIIALRPEQTLRPPVLPVPETVQADSGPQPKRDDLAPTGLPTGVLGPPSAGSGSGGGIGNTGNGPGVGDKNGSGGGNNPNGTGPGGGDKVGTPGSPNGSITPTGPIDYRLLSGIPDSTGIVWLRRVRPIVTPEAQADKIHGYVLLEATFNADGTITDIIVRQHLDSMDEAAIAALQKATFRPATIKGVPITLRRVPVKVNVNLN